MIPEKKGFRESHVFVAFLQSDSVDGSLFTSSHLIGDTEVLIEISSKRELEKAIANQRGLSLPSQVILLSNLPLTSHKDEISSFLESFIEVDSIRLSKQRNHSRRALVSSKDHKGVATMMRVPFFIFNGQKIYVKMLGGSQVEKRSSENNPSKSIYQKLKKNRKVVRARKRAAKRDKKALRREEEDQMRIKENPRSPLVAESVSHQEPERVSGVGHIYQSIDTVFTIRHSGQTLTHHTSQRKHFRLDETTYF